MKVFIICLSIIHLIITTHIAGAAVLESPNQGVNLSGIGFISGWKCHATDITITINDGEHLPVAMYQERSDLLGVCGSTRHGFIIHVNWAWPMISDGEHVVVAYDKGVEFDRVEFTVGTLGEEFVSGVERRKVIEDFPSPNEYTVMEWNESTQHFEVLSVLGGEAGNNYDPTFWDQFDPHHSTYKPVWEEELLYEEVPNVEQCQAGRLTDLAKNRALETVNHIRALVGAPLLKYGTLHDYTYDFENDDHLQQAALIQRANNFSDHSPPSSSKCYTEEGEAASINNIGGGLLKNHDPASSIIQLANDVLSGTRINGVGHRYSLISPYVGHRHSLLSPYRTHFSYGQVESRAMASAFTADYDPQINVDFIAFPYGNFPKVLLHGNPPWSFSARIPVSGSRYQNATVTVSRVSNNKQLPISHHYKNEAYNLMSWQVEGWQHNTLYEVSIKNVTLENGTTRDYSYKIFIRLPR